MDGTIIAAIVMASGAIVVGTMKLLKHKQKGRAASTIGDVTDSLVAVGTNIHQTYSPTVYNHYAEPQIAEPFSNRESKPTIADIMEDLAKERKPYEANQIPKHYIGLQVCWPISIEGLWQSTFSDTWTVRLASADYERCMVFVVVDIEQCPKLKVVDRGHRAWVKGQIKHVDWGEIYLEDGARITLE
jgi:hypothetical protein